MTKENNLVLYLALLILLLLLVLLFQSYNSKCSVINYEGFQDGHPSNFNTVYKGIESEPSVAELDNKQRNINDISSGIQDINGSDPNGNAVWNAVPEGVPSEGMDSCFPRDSLTSKDLLPSDATETKWDKMNPSTGGSIYDPSMLSAGYHIGTSSVMRNPNLQLRSETPNPTKVVSPFLNSTVQPDLYRKEMEIGSAPSYN
tara:strand:- start:13983 stop:14585 length:603 start_codon:yes stop_codon:yes gene_type:complete